MFTGDKNDYTWIKDVVAQCCDGVNAKIGWHFCFGNAWGNDILSANFPEGYQTVLPNFFDTPGIDQFVLDYANRNMAGIEFMKNLPKDKDLQVGVLDIRTSMIESQTTIADRIRQVLKYVPADRVYPSTDCGMKPLARMVAKMKLANAGRRCGDRSQGSRRKVAIHKFKLEGTVSISGDKKIIAVMGATGSQGGGLVRAIQSDPSGGFKARAITRDPNSDKAKALKDLGAEVVGCRYRRRSKSEEGIRRRLWRVLRHVLLGALLSRKGTAERQEHGAMPRRLPVFSM